MKLEAWYHLTANLSYPLMIVLSVLLLPAMIIRFYQGWFQMLYIDLPLFWPQHFPFPAFTSCRSASCFPKTWPRAFLYLPFLMALGIGLTITNTTGVLEALVGQQTRLRVRRNTAWRPSRKSPGRQISQPAGMGSVGGIAVGCYFDVPFVTQWQ